MEKTRLIVWMEKEKDRSFFVPKWVEKEMVEYLEELKKKSGKQEELRKEEIRYEKEFETFEKMLLQSDDKDLEGLLEKREEELKQEILFIDQDEPKELKKKEARETSLRFEEREEQKREEKKEAIEENKEKSVDTKGDDKGGERGASNKGEEE